MFRRAEAVDADLLLFPELSFCGYNPRYASAHPMPLEHRGLGVLQLAADGADMHLSVGVPLQAPAGVEIAQVLLSPNTPPRSYAKQRLHSDESRHFVPGDRSLDLLLGGHHLAPAICFESMQPAHNQAALDRGASVLLVSLAKDRAGMERAWAHYAELAQRGGIFVLAVNAVGPTEDFVCAGRSAAWGPNGSLLASLEDQEGLLTIELPPR